MVPARRPLDGPVVWSLAVPLTVLTLGMGLPIDPPDLRPATAIEEALVAHQCRTERKPGMSETDAYRQCLDLQLISLRDDFGRDLKRLSSAERSAIDSACNRIREAEGADSYLTCLDDRLASLRSRYHPASSDPSTVAAAPLAEATLSSSPLADPSAGRFPLERPSVWRSSVLWISTGLAAVLLAAGGLFVATRKRKPTQPVSHQCRACGADVSGPGDLCAGCRHEAAEARKRLAIQRANEQRTGQELAQKEEQRRQREQEGDQGRERARRAEETHVREGEHGRVRQEEQPRDHEPLPMRREQGEQETRQRPEAGVSAQQVFDPYAILGVSRDASKDDIRAAYQEAKMKYDVDQVSHLGVDVQEHYKAKAQAVERAYQQLTE